MVVAKPWQKAFEEAGGRLRTMKAVVNNFVQLLAIIMAMITLAVSMAAASMVFG